jgi:hypothetical protein
MAKGGFPAFAVAGVMLLLTPNPCRFSHDKCGELVGVWAIGLWHYLNHIGSVLDCGPAMVDTRIV